MRSFAGWRAGASIGLLLAACATSGPVRTEGAAAFDVEHYALDLEIDPAARSLRGTCTVRLWSTLGDLRTVALDLVGLDVESVADGRARPLGFEHADGVLSIELAEPLRAGDFVELAIRYGGVPRQGLWFTREQGGVPTQVHTHGECIEARAWFPCRDVPGERATSALTVRVPRGWRVLCAGERLERREEGALAIERWDVTFPHPSYLETLVAGELAFVESTWDGIPLVFAGAPELADHLAPAFAETDEILAFLSEATGVRYPFPKYAQAAMDGFQYGGMENLSATTVTATAVGDAAARADQPPAGLVAHEAAHQWFGDLVTCRDWSHAWLNEGFATYFTALYEQHARGEDAFRLQMADLRAGWLARDVGANRRPLVFTRAGDPIELFFSGHVYAGGAARLHHLRCLLGEEAFRRGVQRYLASSSGRSVETADLRRALEEASGRDLRVHFERWFESTGHPVVAARWEHDAARAEIALELEQVQAEPPFPCLVEVEIAGAAGVRVERCELDGRQRRVTLAQAEAPRWVRLDPRCALPAEIREQRTFGQWFALLESAPDAAGRRAAARFLAAADVSAPDDGARAAVFERLAARVDVEPDAAVRLALLEGLAQEPERAPRATWLRAARDDADPRVRAQALRALEPEAPDPDLVALARAEIERGASHVATGAALGLLVRADACDALGVLAAEAERPSLHGARAVQVLAQIARLRDPRRLDVLQAWARDERAPDPARQAAIAALAGPAREREDVRGTLIALLGSRRMHVRRQAIAALEGVTTSDVRSALSGLARSTGVATERTALERALRAGE